MVATATEPLEEREAALEKIGATLRRAREAAGFSIADVAERLHLTRRHIEDLEAARFDDLPVSVFVRGYLTNYARLLEIDPEPLLEAYDQRGFGPPQLRSQEIGETGARGSEFVVTVTTLIVVAVLIALSALWWQEQWGEDSGIPSAVVEQTDEEGTPRAIDGGPGEPANEPAPQEPVVRAGATDAPGDTPPPVTAGAEPAQTTPAAEAQAPAQTTAAAEAPAPAQTTARAVEDAEEPAQDVSESDQDPEPAPVPAEPDPSPSGEAEQPPAGEPASLVIRVREDCWLMIRDANQRLIYRNLAVAGTILDLSAVPPLQVVAGYARGIEIEYKGEPFDLSPFVPETSTVARFRLDP